MMKTLWPLALCLVFGSVPTLAMANGYTFTCNSSRGPTVTLVTEQQTQPNLVVSNQGVTQVEASVAVHTSVYEGSTQYDAEVPGKGSVAISVYDDGSAFGSLLLNGQTFELACSSTAH